MPKLIVMYPKPTDVEAFEKVYAEEHVPMVREKMPKATLRAIKIVGAPRGEPPFYRIAEMTFATAEDMQETMASEGGRATGKHAFQISSGGAPVFMFADDA